MINAYVGAGVVKLSPRLLENDSPPLLKTQSDGDPSLTLHLPLQAQGPVVDDSPCPTHLLSTPLQPGKGYVLATSFPRAVKSLKGSVDEPKPISFGPLMVLFKQLCRQADRNPGKIKPVHSPASPARHSSSEATLKSVSGWLWGRAHP